jgi:NitT/TauT family transport system substrate-binding protein
MGGRQTTGKRRPPRRLRAFVVAALAALALTVAACGDSDDSGSGGGGSGPEKTSLRVGILTIGDLLPFWVAQEQGYFKQEGLKVKEVEMAGGAAIQPAVASGDLDLGWSNIVSVVLAQSRNLDFKFLGGGAFLGPGHYKNQAIMVRKGSPVTDAKQLEGKTIGVNTLNNINHLSIKAYLDRIGVDPDSVKFLELGTPNTIEALAGDRVDAVAANEPFVTIGLQSGAAEALVYNPFKSFGKEPFLAGFMSTPRWLEENPKTAEAFTRAVAKGVARVKAKPKEANELLVKITTIKPALAEKMTPSLLKPRITKADIEPWIGSAKKYGMTENTFPASDVLWEGAE